MQGILKTNKMKQQQKLDNKTKQKKNTQ